MKSILVLIACIVAVQAIAFPSTPKEFSDWMCGENQPCPDRSIPEVRRALLKKLHDIATEALETPEGMRKAFSYFFDHHHQSNPLFQRLVEDVISHHEVHNAKKHAEKAKAFAADPTLGFTPPGNNPYPYFAFLPPFVTSVIPNGQEVSFSSPCFRNNVASATLTPDNKTLTVLFQISNASSLLCSDMYLMGSVNGISLQSFWYSGDHVISIDLSNATAAQQWDIKQKGLRVFRFMDDAVQTIYDLLDTVTMFLGPLTHAFVDDVAAANNIYFLQEYTKIQPFMAPRNDSVVALPPDYLQSGDFIGIVRLDGLDPMLAWAMGSTTGHTVVAMRAPNNTLYFCESTTVDSYWPTNGIQCTEYNQWIVQAVNADHNVVVVPLAPQYRQSFNSTNAWAFFESTRGLDYGYHNMLWGWIDTISQNYPCLPPNYNQCLQWEHLEVLFGYMDQILPSVGDILFNQAWNIRMNTTGLLAADLFYLAAQRGMPSNVIPTIVEQDSWNYQTTRYGVPTVGKSQVCCTFVCNMWKAGGVFNGINNQVNCVEQTNFDDYSLNLFDPARIGANRPASCVAQDPTNPLCQIVGKYTLNLNGLNTRQPYPHMDEQCPTEAPAYSRPSNC